MTWVISWLSKSKFPLTTMGPGKLLLCKSISPLPVLLPPYFSTFSIPLLLPCRQFISFLPLIDWFTSINVNFTFFTSSTLLIIYAFHFLNAVTASSEKEEGGIKESLREGRGKGTGCFPFPAIWTVLTHKAVSGLNWRCFLTWKSRFFIKTTYIASQAHMKR